MQAMSPVRTTPLGRSRRRTAGAILVVQVGISEREYRDREVL
jgi:hypothetical protein